MHLETNSGLDSLTQYYADVIPPNSEEVALIYTSVSKEENRVLHLSSKMLFVCQEGWVKCRYHTGNMPLAAMLTTSSSKRII